MKNTQRTKEAYFRTLNKEEKNRNAWTEGSDSFWRCAKLSNFQNKTLNSKEKR